MKVQTFRKLQQTDFQEAPQWFFRAADVLNKVLEETSNAVSGQQSIIENANNEQRTLSLSHDVTQRITLQSLKGRPQGVIVLSDTSTDYPRLKWTVVDDETVDITVKWDSGSTGDKYDVTLLIIGP